MSRLTNITCTDVVRAFGQVERGDPGMGKFVYDELCRVAGLGEEYDVVRDGLTLATICGEAVMAYPNNRIQAASHVWRGLEALRRHD